MSFEDSGRIIPLFYLFSSLFSHSLISIHDNEFFGDPIEGKALFNGASCSVRLVGSGFRCTAQGSDVCATHTAVAPRAELAVPVTV